MSIKTLNIVRYTLHPAIIGDDQYIVNLSTIQLKNKSMMTSYMYGTTYLVGLVNVSCLFAASVCMYMRV